VTGDFAEEMARVAAEPQVPPWCSYVAWREGVPVGFGGFKEAPAGNGAVEIGYLTFPSQLGRGVATTIARELAAVAKANGAQQVIAHTLPNTNASTRVLEKAGFARDGWGEDDDVGRVWRWRLDLLA
jgi:RimJ/RimL family protein N-acetyltransferase